MYAIGSSARKGFGSLATHDWSPGVGGIDELALGDARGYYHEGFGLPLALVGPVASVVGGLFNAKATRSNVVQRFQIMQSGGTPGGSAIGGVSGARTIIDQVYAHMVGDDPSWSAEWQQILNVAIPELQSYMHQKLGVGSTTPTNTGGVTGSPNQPGGGLNISQAGIGGLLFSPLGIGLGLAILLLSRRGRR